MNETVVFLMINTAKKVIENEIQGLSALIENLPQDFDNVVNLILKNKGRLILSGIGKSGYIANKISASFASTGTPAIYIHPAEASHGDLGMIHSDDIVILLSNSGETSEIMDILSYCKRFHITLVAMTMKTKSLLAQSADFVLNIPELEEASAISVPTTSAVTMLALGDALMVSVYESRGFTKDDYKLLHPGGKIGANLKKVCDLMHTGDSVPAVMLEMLMSEVLIRMTEKGFGVAAVINQDNSLCGIITDGDLRRHMSGNIVNMSAQDIMTPSPKTIVPTMLAIEALTIMNDKSITSLLVVEDMKLRGIIHIHDILRAGIG
jgi:arabinose-5-phosphate isomerase